MSPRYTKNRRRIVEILIQIFILALRAQVADQKPQDIVNNEAVRRMFDGMEVENIIDLSSDRDICSDQINNYKKNFTAPGRRISEVKCLEYIWESRLAERDVDKEELCSAEVIAGGRPAFYGEFPHMGALGWRSAYGPEEWVFKCGATLVSERFMVTAAHCSRATRSDSTIVSVYPEVVKLGDKFITHIYPEENEKSHYKDFNELILSFKAYRRHEITDKMKPKYVPIKRIITHKNYKSPKRYYDIAIIELTEPVSLSALIRPACLWSSSDTSGLERLSITGWGVVDPVTREATTELQVAEVDLIGDETCDQKLNAIHNRNWNGLADHQICAGFLAGGIDSCQGDSGGPLKVKINLTQKWPMYYLVGVTSFGHGCALADTPAVYVKISSFIDWIESTVWPDG